MANKSLSQDLLDQLYSRGKSMSEIAMMLHCSVNTVVYWMNKYSIYRRSLSDAIYTKHNPHGDPFSIKETFTPEEWYLFGLGIGIYWGEGNKLSPHVVRVTNTDPAVITSFVAFLRTICRIRENKLSYSLVCFNDSNSDEAARHWAKALKISPTGFGKIVSIPTQGKGTYTKKSKFGVCTVTFCNIKLKTWIMKQIEEARIVYR